MAAKPLAVAMATYKSTKVVARGKEHTCNKRAAAVADQDSIGESRSLP